MIALVCPNCGGPLPGEASTLPQVTCAFCSVVVSRVAHEFKTAEGSVAKGPSDDRRRRMLLFSEAVTKGLGDGDPRAVLEAALLEHLGMESEAAVVAQITMGLAAELEKESGVDVSRQAMPFARMAEGYMKCLDELRETGAAELSLPFITATDQGPIHFHQKLTIPYLQALARGESPNESAGGGGAARTNKKKKWWWPFG